MDTNGIDEVTSKSHPVRRQPRRGNRDAFTTLLRPAASGYLNSAKNSNPGTKSDQVPYTPVQCAQKDSLSLLVATTVVGSRYFLSHVLTLHHASYVAS